MKVSAQSSPDFAGGSLQQRGMALVLGLLFLLVISLLVTSTMNSATLNERMSLNWQVSNNTFQQAERAARDAQNDVAFLGNAINQDLSIPIENRWVSSDRVTDSTTGMNRRAQVVFLNERPIGGFSMDASGQGYSGFVFAVRGASLSGNDPNSGVNSIVVNGFYKVGPSL